MEAIDFFYGREEDKYLRLYLDFVVKMLEDSTDHKFMHLDSLLQHFVVALDAFQSDTTADLFLDHFVDIEFDEVFHVFIVEGNKLFFHGS